MDTFFLGRIIGGFIGFFQAVHSFGQPYSMIVFTLVALLAWAVVKLAATFIKWLRTRALRDTGRAAGALVHAGKHAVAEMKEGYRNNR